MLVELNRVFCDKNEKEEQKNVESIWGVGGSLNTKRSS